MEPCGTTASIALHWDVLPFKTVRCSPLARNLWIKMSSLPEMQQRRNLNIGPYARPDEKPLRYRGKQDEPLEWGCREMLEM